MGLTIQAAIVLAGAFAFFGAWYVLQKNVLLGAALVLAAFVAHATVISYSPLEYQGINFYPEDLVFALLATVAVPRAFALRGRPWTQVACFGFCVSVLAGFILGALDNNLKLSGVECRPYFYFSTCALYFATFSYTRSNIAKLAWLGSAATLGLIVVASYRWMAQILDLPVMVSWVNTSQATTLRVLAANEALFLWQAFLFNLYLRVSSPAAKTFLHISGVAAGVDPASTPERLGGNAGFRRDCVGARKYPIQAGSADWFGGDRRRRPDPAGPFR